MQRRSLKRLGDVLLEHNYLAGVDLAQVMRLQTTETLYKLFSWKSGSYEFSQEEVDQLLRLLRRIHARLPELRDFTPPKPVSRRSAARR